VSFYLRVFPDGGFEFSPVGRTADGAKLEAGFEIVDKIPAEVLDRCPGGRDYQPAESEVEKLEKRVAALEKAGAGPGG
jgi:hypothetical protein